MLTQSQRGAVGEGAASAVHAAAGEELRETMDVIIAVDDVGLAHRRAAMA